jgi:hypothetical protein
VDNSHPPDSDGDESDGERDQDPRSSVASSPGPPHATTLVGAIGSYRNHQFTQCRRRDVTDLRPTLAPPRSMRFGDGAATGGLRAQLVERDSRIHLGEVFEMERGPDVGDLGAWRTDEFGSSPLLGHHPDGPTTSCHSDHPSSSAPENRRQVPATYHVIENEREWLTSFNLNF